MIVLQTYTDYFAAHLDKSILFEAGIEAVLLDEHTITNNWLYAQGLGGIKLVVDPEDFLRAESILQANDDLSVRHYEEVPELDEENEMKLNPDNKVCIHCGSRNTSATGYSRPAAYLGFLFFGFPFIKKKTEIHCFNCGKQF